MIQDFKNELLNRREIKAIAQMDKTPSFDASAKMIAEQFKVAEENIAVKGVHGKFGRNTFLVEAMIYDSVKDKERIEPKKKVKVKKEGTA